MRGKLGRLYDFLLSKLSPEQVLQDHCPEQEIRFGSGESKNIWCVFHDEANAPSLAVTKEGKFYCHSGGCEARGTSIIQFIQKLRATTLQDTLDYLYHRYVQPIVPQLVNDEYVANLSATDTVLGWLRSARGIKRSIAEQYELGFDNQRVTIPIRNAFGHLINIRRYDHTKTRDIKMLPYKAGYGGLALFPYEQLHHQELVLCEGEWDALLLIQNGFHAVTTTGGVGSWRNEWDELFRDKRVYVCFDVNDHLNVGQRCAKKRATELIYWAKAVGIVELPLDEKGGDITDYFHKHGHTREDFRILLRSSTPVAKVLSVKKELRADGTTAYDLPLNEASKSRYYKQRIITRAVVVGMETAPYIIPQHVEVTCPESRCEVCPFKQTPASVHLLENAATVLHLIGRTKAAQVGAVRSILGIPKDCTAEVKETSHCNLESVRIIPETHVSQIDASYVLRTAFCLGQGLQPNQVYRFEGITTTDHKQRVVHVITQYQPAQTAVESFELTDEIKRRLEVFRPAKGIYEKLNELYNHFSRNVTRILERVDMHMAVDLVFHSPLTFRFNGERVHKGWLEALVIGDTRTGKGFVADGLIRHYQLGAVTSCENSTYAGLVGGNEKIDDKWFTTWGKIPLYDKRLLVLDEASALHVEDVQRMSRVRSEGIAEVTKIHAAQTWARTRLVWLANPRSGRQMSGYSAGVEAIQELVGRNEDVARFDYAVSAANNEVASKIINAPQVSRVASPYTSEVCRNLVLWVWSRTEDQIVFSGASVKAILDASREFGQRYSAAIPLVQTENIRIKLAKVSAAIAARVFSADDTGERLLVDQSHVEAAKQFLHSCYTKPSMGYNVFSNATLDRDTLKSPKELDAKIDALKEQALDFVEGCLELSQITPADLMDYASKSREWAQEMTSFLVRQRAVKKEGLAYVKKAAFVDYLRTKRETYKINGTPAGALF